MGKVLLSQVSVCSHFKGRERGYLPWTGVPTLDGGRVYLPWMGEGAFTLDRGKGTYFGWGRGTYLGQGKGTYLGWVEREPTLNGGEGTNLGQKGRVPTLEGGGVPTLDGGIPIYPGQVMLQAVCPFLASHRRTFLFYCWLIRVSLLITLGALNILSQQMLRPLRQFYDN